MVRPTCRILLCLAATVLIGARPLHAQGAAPDTALVARGKTIFTTRSCTGCHKFGAKLAGPDLTGVEKRRSRAWLVRFLKNTSQMLTGDSTAMGLVKQWKGAKMPQVALSDQDVDAVLAYVTSAGTGKGKK